MKRNLFIRYYVPCSEVQRAKIEVLRNMRRLFKYYIRKGTHPAEIPALINSLYPN